MRVSEDDILRALMWARNYGEIESFKVLPTPGRRYLIKLPADDITVEGGDPRLLSNLVPGELALTGREALAFAFGCAAAGARQETRRSFAAREWGWDA